MQSIVILHLHITPLDFKSNTQAFSFIFKGSKKKYIFNCVGITDFFCYIYKVIPISEAKNNQMVDKQSDKASSWLLMMINIVISGPQLWL